MNLLITGGNGQLGRELFELQKNFSHHTYFFTDVDTLNICDEKEVDAFCEKNQIQTIINAAAYTAVDRAESEPELAFKINADGVLSLVNVCHRRNIFLIHTSTDYVFDGLKTSCYQENDLTHPLSAYGKSKLAGEQHILSSGIPSLIVRTSWLYSAFGANFVKTMLRISKELPQLRVVNDQTGAPTYGADLAKVLLIMLDSEKRPAHPEIYHFADTGKISWYDFAREIMRITENPIDIVPVCTSEYKTAAVRPANSHFCLDKIVHDYHLEIPDWKDSLRVCLGKILQ
jgi:dTDP-4-dehydrorhamnose reductase